jgi:hypothetical protein
VTAGELGKEVPVTEFGAAIIEAFTGEGRLCYH